ncbi:hypothetical protein ACFLYF_01460 [Chloroflexota bacterium]
MKKTKGIKTIKPMGTEEMTNDKLAEDVFGKRLTKKLKKIAHSDKPVSQSDKKIASLLAYSI